MTAPWRLLAVPAAAGVLYLSVILAGLSGFDPAIWAFYTALFLVWHILIHTQGPSIMAVLAVHAIVAAAVLGLGAMIGGWVDFAPPLIVPLGLGVGAMVVARLVRLPSEELERIAELADEARARIEAAQPAPEPETPPEPAQPPEDHVDAPSESAPTDGVTDALERATVALDALPPQGAGHDDLAAAIAPAIGPVPLDDLVSELFARARAPGHTRDLKALTVLLSDPQVARDSIGAGDSDAAFHLIRAVGDAEALSHWVDQSVAMLDDVPEAWADMPDVAALREAADAIPSLRVPLQAMIDRRPDGEPERPESP